MAGSVPSAFPTARITWTDVALIALMLVFTVIFRLCGDIPINTAAGISAGMVLGGLTLIKAPHLLGKFFTGVASIVARLGAAGQQGHADTPHDKNDDSIPRIGPVS